MGRLPVVLRPALPANARSLVQRTAIGTNPSLTDGVVMKNTLLASSMLISSLVFGACVTADDVADDPEVDSSGEAIEACAAVHIITARASTENPGEGITGALVDQIIRNSNQTISRAAVDYPATLNNYANSSAQGVSALKTMLTAQVQSCPNQKIVLA